MFNFVSKTFLLHYGRRCSITTTKSNKHFSFPIPIFMKCISTTTTTTTSNQHSFTVSYLINSCGFSPKSALSASKYVHFNSPEKPDSVITLFKSHGFPETQLSKLIRGQPKVLCLSPEKILLPKLEFYFSKGFSRTDLAKISSANPNVLIRSLENYLIPSFNHLSDWFKSNEKAVAAVKCNPHILCHDVETYIAASLNVLRDIGVSDQNILLFLRIRGNFKKISIGTFRNSVEVVKEMDFNPLKSHFVLAVVVKSYGRTYWESKAQIYRRWGWSEEDLLAAFRKYPLCMTASEDKIMMVMDFLVNKMDLESLAIANRPVVISLSMEKRFIPRGAVFQYLLSKGLIERRNTNFIKLFECTEKMFLQRFVNSFDEAPKLLKLYQEKLGILKVTKTSVSSERDALIVN